MPGYERNGTGGNNQTTGNGMRLKTKLGAQNAPGTPSPIGCRDRPLLHDSVEDAINLKQALRVIGDVLTHALKDAERCPKIKTLRIGKDQKARIIEALETIGAALHPLNP